DSFTRRDLQQGAGRVGRRARGGRGRGDADGHAQRRPRGREHRLPRHRVPAGEGVHDRPDQAVQDPPRRAVPRGHRDAEERPLVRGRREDHPQGHGRAEEADAVRRLHRVREGPDRRVGQRAADGEHGGELRGSQTQGRL
ncbi:MAG: Acyl carrier protein, partial [uncultured Phycisphaerae bacterium]